MSKKKPPHHPPVSEEESILFRETVGNVTPVHCDRVVHPHQRKRCRSHHRQQLPHAHHSEPMEKFGLSYQAPDKTLLRKLRQGLVPIDGRLDLHGKKHLQAESALKQFIEQACFLNCHCILIIHGKGFNSQESTPVLKELTHYLLSQHDMISAYSIADKKHGGEGATYALLRNHF